jgi:hypothetical protein
MKGWMKLGRKMPVFDTDDSMGAPSPAPDNRVDALEARIAQLTNIVTQQAQAQQRQTQVQAQQTHVSAAESIVRDSEAKIALARTKLAQAYEAADSNLIAAATAEVGTATAEATAARMNFEQVKRNVATQPQAAVPQPAAQRIDDANLRTWRDKNKEWYGVDPELTRVALEIDREVRAEKILEVGSVQYFNALDARLRAKFPDKFQSNANPSQFQVQRGSKMPNTTPQGTRIPASVADGFRRMGLDVDNPEVAKQLVQARETAVRKGFLPSTPVTDRILSR